MPDTPMSRIESDAEKSARHARSLWRRALDWFRSIDAPEDEPNYDPRPEDVVLLRYNRELQEEVDQLRRRVRELQAGQDMVDATAYAIPVMTSLSTERQNPLTIGTREPNQRAKAPTWRDRMRTVQVGRGGPDVMAATKARLASERVRQACAKVHYSDGRKAPTNNELADRFDAATQAARELQEKT